VGRKMQTAYYDIDLEWFKTRKIENQVAIAIGMLAMCGFRITQGKKGWRGTGYAKHPKSFECLIWFFENRFPSTINSHTKEEVKSGGNVYRNNKLGIFVWHVSGKAKLEQMMEYIGLKFKEDNSGICHCGADLSNSEPHDKECSEYEFE
jgi:hypothetical protein